VAIREIAGIQHLDPSLVVAIKIRVPRRAISLNCIGLVREPDSHVINLDGAGGRIDRSVVGEHGRGRGNAGSLDEGFFAENAGEVSHTLAFGVSENVSLIPSQPKRILRCLEEERSELCGRSQAEYLDLHVLNRSQVADSRTAGSCR